MNQLQIGIARMAIDRQFQGINPARTGRDQRNDRAAETGGKRIDINANFLLLGDIEHIQRHDARNAQLQQL
ncbi:hypothetical protein D3C72_1123130 [compost metagenome]